MARIKYYDSEAQTWKYADSQYVIGSGGNVYQSDSVFKGKTASFYGDSLTEVNHHYTKGYHSWVNDLLGLASYRNYGVSGYKVSDVYNKVNSVNDTADVIFVMCGVNDQNFSVPLGTMSDNTTGTTYGALNLLCALLKQKYPTSIVVFITPHYQTKYPHSNGITSYEVSKAIREVCEKYAIPVYDNYALSGIYSTNLSTFTTDNCHWNNIGHEMVGKNLAHFMENTFRYIHGGTGGGESHTHSYTETVTTAASCTTEGVKTFSCECGDKYTQSIPATGHKWNSGVVTVEPTEETEGVRTYTCTVCGETRTETIPTLDHEHSYTSEVTTESTCTTDGVRKYTCSVCGDTYTETIAANGHNYVDGVCSVCGASDPDYVPPAVYPDYDFNGKTFTITGPPNGQFHLTALIPTTPQMVNGAVVEQKVSVSNFDTSNATQLKWTGCFEDTSGDVSNSKFGAEITTCTPFLASSGSGDIVFENSNRTFESNATADYLKVPLCIKCTTIPMSFKINGMSIKIGGVEQEIIKIGGFFTADTYTIT